MRDYAMYRMLFLLIILIISGCSPEREEAVPVEPALVLVSVSPSEGAVGIGSGLISVIFTFNQPVVIAAPSLISINGIPAPSSTVQNQTLEVRFEATPSTAYRILISRGSIKTLLGTTSSTDFSVSFSTESSPQSGGKSGSALKLLNYLNEIAGIKTLSGSMSNVNWNINEATWIYSHTGRWPSINGFDYLHIYASESGGWIDYSDISVVENWWNAGGIVSAMWHWNLLANDGISYTYSPGVELDGNHTSFNLSKIEDTNSLEYIQLTRDIDKVASYLKLLQSKGIPVLWRPLHEAAGNRYVGGDAWFWWGAYGAEPFKKLWRLMYDRFVNMHSLNNLIWVWTYEPAGYAEWYPGDEYVDLVGSDIYGEGDVSRISDRYRAMRKNFANKPTVLSECGSVSLISEQWASGARWLYFMPWYDYGRTNDMTADGFRETSHEHADIRWWLDAFNCEFVLSRDELPNLK